MRRDRHPRGRVLPIADGAGRVKGPELLFEAWGDRRIALETLQSHIGDVWSMAEYPDRALGRDAWRELSGAAGYTEDGKAVERPAERIRLWRGAVPEPRRDWSWTDDQTVAEQ